MCRHISLILLLITVECAISQESSVENCYSDSLCSSNGQTAQDDSISPLECCSRLGYSYISMISSTCVTCFVAGFQVTSEVIGGHTSTSNTFLIQSRSKLDFNVLHEILLSLTVIESNSNKPINDLVQQFPDMVTFRNGTTARLVLETTGIDNEIALEPNYEYTIELNHLEVPPGTSVFLIPSQLHLSIIDPDSVFVSFSSSKYTVSEDSDSVLVQLLQVGAAASNFTITITCENLLQIHTVTAQASASAQALIDFKFLIPKDVVFSDNLLELLEISQVSDDRVVITSPNTAEVFVIKDDAIVCGFVQNIHTFYESNGTVSMQIKCSNSIEEQLQLVVSGGPTDQPDQVIISGVHLSETVTFFPNESLVQTIFFNIRDDNVSLELIESYVLQLFIVDSSRRGVTIGNTAIRLYSYSIIHIKDEDNTILTMETDTLSVSENIGLVDICAVLSQKAAVDIEVTFASSPLTATDPDDYLGSITHKTIAAGQFVVCATYNIQIDGIVEQNEEFVVTISNYEPQGNSHISLGQHTNTTVTILDGGEGRIEPVCVEEIDIVFILDASGSIGLDNFATITRFVIRLSENFQLGGQATQIGVVVFGNEADVEIKLGEYDRIEEFTEPLMNVQYRATTTNTAQALELAASEIQSSDRFGPQLPGIFILFTDGQSNDPNATAAAAMIAKSLGIRILVIGIGPSINLNELRGVASDPDSEHVFLIDDFSPLSFASILSPLVQTTCEILIGFFDTKYDVNEGESFVDVTVGVLDGVLTKEVIVNFLSISGTAKDQKDFTGLSHKVTLSPQNHDATIRINIIDDNQLEELEFFTLSISTPNEFVKVTVPSSRVFISDNDGQSCKRQLDIIMLLDTSTSIDDFETMKEFAIFFISEYQLGVSGAQIGVITIGSVASISLSLGEHTTSATCQEAVSKLKFEGGRRNIAEAINLATQQFIFFGRSDAQHIMIVFVAGVLPIHDRTIAAAAIARGHGIKIISIGKKFAIDMDQLKGISSDPDDQNMFLLSNFSSNSFDDLLKPLVQHICFPMCKRRLELIVALQPSDRSELEIMKQYISKMAKKFVFAENKARFGGIYSSDHPTSLFKLGSNNDTDSLNLAIQSIQYIPAMGSISTTFDVAVQHFKTYGRHGVPKVYIQLLPSANVEATNQILKHALDLDIQIFTIEFGEQVAAKVDSFFDANDPNSLGEISKVICNVPSCQNPPLDIIFALDASTTIDRTESTVHNFVVDMALNYKISEENTHIGVIRYTMTAEVAISLVQFLELHKLSEAIFDVHYNGGITDQATAIVTAQQEFIRNGRAGAKHILILTSGTINDVENARKAAELAKKMKIEIFVLHIGESDKEDSSISSDPKAEHSIMIKSPNVDAFSSIIPQLTRDICSHEEPPLCSRKSEIAFLVDASSSFGLENFNNAKRFVVEIITQLDIGSMLTRVAVIVYSSHINPIIRLAQIQSKEEIIQKIHELDFTVYQANQKLTGSAINIAQQELNSIARVGVAKFMYVISSGESSSHQHTIEGAEAARDSGTVIVTVGIGSNGSQTELQDIASSNSKFFTAPQQNLNALLQLTDNFVEIVCTQEPVCTLDLVFVVDSTISQYSEVLKFVARVVSQFDVSVTATHVGFISYGSIATSDGPYGFDIGSHEDTLAQIVSLQQFIGSERHTDVAITMAYRQLMNYRLQVPNAVVVITSGISDDPGSTLKSAELLFSLEDTEVFTVAISSDTSEQFIEEIYEISTDPDVHHVFRSSSFRQQSLDLLYDQIIVEFCNDDNNLHADPLFIVPLYRTKYETSHQLCYEIYGKPNQYFNLLSDRCVSVNAHYTEYSRKPRMLHVVDQIAIYSSNNIGQCVEIVMEIDATKKLSVHVNGAKIDQGIKNGEVHVLSYHAHASISVPNCASGKILVMSVQLKSMPGNILYLEFQIHGGNTIHGSAHGLIGQFWNTPIILSKDIDIHFKDQNFTKDVRVLEIKHPSSPLRYVPVWLENTSWNVQKTPCLYAGDSQGGRVYEVESPNDSLIEGTYIDYIVNNLFSTQYRFSKFNETYCTRVTY